MEIKNYNYNMKQIHAICYTDEFLHLIMKFKENKVKDIRCEETLKVDQTMFEKVLSEFYKCNYGNVINIVDIKSNNSYAVNLSTIAKINYANGKLYLLESFGNNVGYNVDKETADDIIKKFNNQ